MNNLRKWGAWLGAGAVVMTLSAGCADRNKNGQPDSVATTEETNSAVKEGVDTTAKAADNAGEAIANGANKMGSAVAKGADNAVDAVSGTGTALATTSKVKTALGANGALKGSMIDVDTNGDTKTVSLKGTVKTDTQKNLAAAVAKREVPGFKINNQLKVVK